MEQNLLHHHWQTINETVKKYIKVIYPRKEKKNTCQSNSQVNGKEVKGAIKCKGEGEVYIYARVISMFLLNHTINMRH